MLEEVDVSVVDGVENVVKILSGVYLESWFVFGELCDVRLGVFGGSVYDVEDVNDLIFVGGVGEERVIGVYFSYDVVG